MRTPAVRTVLNWVVGAPFVGSALSQNFVTLTATVTDANGHQGRATRTLQLTSSAPNGQELTPQPDGSGLQSVEDSPDGERLRRLDR